MRGTGLLSPLTILGLTGIGLAAVAGLFLLSVHRRNEEKKGFLAERERLTAGIRVDMRALRYDAAIAKYDELLLLSGGLSERARRDVGDSSERYRREREDIIELKREEEDRIADFIRSAENLMERFDADAAMYLLDRSDWLLQASQGRIQAARDLRRRLAEELLHRESPCRSGPAGEAFRFLVKEGRYRDAADRLAKFKQKCGDPAELAACRGAGVDLTLAAREGLAELASFFRDRKESMTFEEARAWFDVEIRDRWADVLPRAELDRAWNDVLAP